MPLITMASISIEIGQIPEVPKANGEKNKHDQGISTWLQRERNQNWMFVKKIIGERTLPLICRIPWRNMFKIKGSMFFLSCHMLLMEYKV